jgi:hypothetical protein
MGLMNSLQEIPWLVGALIMALMLLVFAAVGIIFLRYSVNKQHFKAHHDVAGFVFTNLGVLYAVLLGFTVVNVQQRFDSTKAIVEVEAAALLDLYRDAGIFEEHDRSTIQQSIKDYIQAVLAHEWNSGPDEINATAEQAMKDIWKAYYNIGKLSDIQREWYAQSIRKMNDVASARLTRLLGSKESLGEEMWVLLLLGAISIVSFLWFFSFENITLHLLMAAVLSAATAFLLFLIYSLDTAFHGSIQISPEAFIKVLQALEG